MNEIIYGQEDTATGPSGGSAISFSKYSKYISVYCEYHQYNLTPFSDVLAPDTSNTTMLEIDQATALRGMGIRLINELYDGIRIPNQNNHQ